MTDHVNRSMVFFLKEGTTHTTTMLTLLGFVVAVRKLGDASVTVHVMEIL